MTRVRSPCSVSSLAAQPPVIPEPTTMASYDSLRCGDMWAWRSRDRAGAVRQRWALLPSGGPRARAFWEGHASVEAAGHLDVAQLFGCAGLCGVIAEERQLLHCAEERRRGAAGGIPRLTRAVGACGRERVAT